jgi:hypothetical protein
MPLLLSLYQFPDLRKVDFHFYHVQADKRKGGLKVLNSTAPKLQVLRLSLGKTYAFPSFETLLRTKSWQALVELHLGIFSAGESELIEFLAALQER